MSRIEACPNSPTSPSTSKRSRNASRISTLHRVRLRSPFLLRYHRPAPRRLPRQTRRRPPPHRQAHRHRPRRRRFAGPAPDDRRAPALGATPGADRRRKIGLAALDFAHGTLVLTEAGTKRRASLHIVRGDAGSRAHDPGGIDVLDGRPRRSSPPALRRRTTRSSAPSPTRGSSAASATPTPTRSSTARGSRR